MTNEMAMNFCSFLTNVKDDAKPSETPKMVRLGPNVGLKLFVFIFLIS